MPFRKNPRLSCFLLQVTPKTPLNAPTTPLNAPTTPDEDPSRLYGTPPHSQLLDAAREGLKVHIPRLCGTEVAAASPFGPWTAAAVTATPSPLSFRSPRGFSDTEVPRRAAAPAPQRGRRAPGHTNRLMRSSFLGPNLKAYRTAPQIQSQSSAAPE